MTGRQTTVVTAAQALRLLNRHHHHQIEFTKHHVELDAPSRKTWNHKIRIRYALWDLLHLRKWLVSNPNEFDTRAMMVTHKGRKVVKRDHQKRNPVIPFGITWHGYA